MRAMVARRAWRAALVALALGGESSAALAHPHVWVAVRAELLFDAQARVVGVREHWTFDDMYSAFITADLGHDGEPPTPAELAPVAKTNVESLRDFSFFTFMPGQNFTWGPALDETLVFDPKTEMATLTFTLTPPGPIPAAPLVFQIYDPSFFVSLSFEKKDPVALVGAPPRCSMEVRKPEKLEAADAQKLDESFFNNLSPGDDFGVKLADRVIVTCP